MNELIYIHTLDIYNPPAMLPENYIHLYIGSNTTMGKLVNVHLHSCFTELNPGERVETLFTQRPFPVKLHLIRLRELSHDQSKQLIAKGISIGRPRGYSFSPEAFSFLLSCRVDLYGLIDGGLAVAVDKD